MTTATTAQIYFGQTDEPGTPIRFAINAYAANWNATDVIVNVLNTDYVPYFSEKLCIIDAVHWSIDGDAAGVICQQCRQYNGRTTVSDYNNFGQRFETLDLYDSGTIYGPSLINMKNIGTQTGQIFQMYFKAGTYAATDDVYLTVIGRLYKRYTILQTTAPDLTPPPQPVNVENINEWPWNRRRY